MKKRFLLFLFGLFALSGARATYIFIPMDESQTQCLKAYGIAFMVLKEGGSVEWLLNYRGGSFVFPDASALEDACKIRNVKFELIADAQEASIIQEISNPEVNMDAVKLEKPPRIAVYSPKNKLPWDDAVTLALTYAEIPYDVIYDEEILNGVLPKYDWLHLHHEDFTGQYGKFWGAFQNAAWYQEDVKTQEAMAKKMGYQKVSQMKLAVAKKIREFVSGGGFLFAMCSAPDSYDIALAAEGIDICQTPFDGDPADPDCNKKLNYDACFAFKGFTLNMNSYDYTKSDIDTSPYRVQKYGLNQENDFFTLFDFSAKWDPIPTMLCQDHTKVIKGFWGQTTGFNEQLLKTSTTIMGENKGANEAKYIHGDFGKGTWTFYGGHDPECYQHRVGDPPTDLTLHPNSAGYRLILNNVLFPAAKKKKRET
ncbi:MAG TPA: asparagine synthetase B [Bacteroidia bacterium]|jgi:hypothetical protein|nr:asparagine synthetase B [Bacteroidia bacterium]